MKLKAEMEQKYIDFLFLFSKTTLVDLHPENFKKCFANPTKTFQVFMYRAVLLILWTVSLTEVKVQLKRCQLSCHRNPYMLEA